MSVHEREGVDLVPHTMPREKLVQRIKADFEHLSQDFQILHYWTTVLLDESRRHHIGQEIAGFNFRAAGFLDPEREANAFGLIVYASLSYEHAEGTDVLPSMEVDGEKFPVAVRRAEEVWHGPIAQPFMGTSTCWGRSRISSQRPRGPGMLTAGHVITRHQYKQPAVGARIQLTDGSSSRVMDVGPGLTDVVLISGRDRPQQPPIPVHYPIVPWMDVQFTDASARTVDTKVSSVPDNRGVYDAPTLPVRFFTAKSGNYGDSGSLMTEPSTRMALGFYLGALKNPAGLSEGVAQSAYQAALLMDMEIYDA